MKQNYLSVKQNPDLLSPFAKLERLGQVYRFPGGAALTYAEMQEENTQKIEVIAHEINQGNRIHLRAHAQMEPAVVKELYQVKKVGIGEDVEASQEELRDLLHLNFIQGETDSSASAFEFMGAYHCGGLQNFGPIGGVVGALKQTEELVEKLSTKIGVDQIKQKIIEGMISVGVELPGNLTIYIDPDNIGKYTKDKKYVVKMDQEKISALNGKDTKSKWLVCVDERVGGGETSDYGPGSIFPHATAVIGIANQDDPESLAFAASLDNLRLIDPKGNVEPASAGLRYIIPQITNVSEKQSLQFTSAVADLWELLCTEMLTHSGTSGGNWSVGTNNSTETLPIYRPNFWAQMKRFLDFHHGTIAVTYLEGTINQETKKNLIKLKVPVIEIPR